jgi:hypothetical protein
MAFAAILGTMLMTTQAANATTNSTATETNATTIDEYVISDYPAWLNGGMGMGPGRGGHHGGGMCGGPFGAVEVSTAFQEKVTTIAENDTDVQTLINEGYNVTLVRPIIKTVVDEDGNVVTKATSAVVLLQKDTTGGASVLVDLEQERVTQIVIMTRTVIDKS